LALAGFILAYPNFLGTMLLFITAAKVSRKYVKNNEGFVLPYKHMGFSG
jgi:hypothetical protein